MRRLSVRMLVGLLFVAGCKSDSSVGVEPADYTLERLQSTTTFTGTGTGQLTALTMPATAKSETWTITVTAAAANGGTFSVVGSKSGTLAAAVTGTPYSNTGLAFTITDGTTDFVVGDRFTVTTSNFPAEGMAIGQDSTAFLLIGVKRAGTDTLIQGSRLEYSSSNYDIVAVDGAGIVTAVGKGSATVSARLGNASISVPVTVRDWPATSVELTVLQGPLGGNPRAAMPPVGTSLDTGTYFALPADRLTTRLKALVRRGNDTLFCNYCVAKTPARVMRLVRFRSLDTNLAIISNATTPSLQASTDTTGRITPFDTTSVGVKFVLEVPADGLADTVLVKFSLRPIDSLGVRPDSNFFPTANGTGLQKQIYPNANTTEANVKAATTTNFVVGLNFLSRVQDPPLPATPGTAGVVRFIPSRLFGDASVFRKSLPNVTWQSANTDYLDINAAGSVTGKCAAIGGTCSAAGSTVLTCASTTGTMPAAFTGNGTYSVPSCSPARTINPYPGALCTSTSTTDLSAMCSIWVRASALDQVPPFKALSSRYRVNIGR